MSSPEFPELDGLHVFIAKANSKTARVAIAEFLNNGCKVTAWIDDEDVKLPKLPELPNLHVIQDSFADEAPSQKAFIDARGHFGPINVLIIPNTAITDESLTYPIWETPIHQWGLAYRMSVQDTLAAISHFLRTVRNDQQKSESEIPNLAIVITGSDGSQLKNSASPEYMSGSPGILHGLVKAVNRDLQYLNSEARINVLAHVSKPHDIGRAIAHLASHHASGHISGAYASVSMPDRENKDDSEAVNRERVQVTDIASVPSNPAKEREAAGIVTSGIEDALGGTKLREKIMNGRKHHVRIALSVDFDAISAHLGTGKHADNNMSDYSQGIFAGKVGAGRLLRLFKKLGIADKMTWFIPGHSMETFPTEVKQIVDSGCEIGLHGYSHEGAYQMTEEQESDVLQKCIDLATNLTGKKPIGYRAPLYQIRETTIPLLEKHGFEYDSSLTHHDSQPYPLPLIPPIHPPDFARPAATWMHPTPLPSSLLSPSSSTSVPISSLIEIPCNWYGEDETPLSYLPHVNNSHGYVDVRVIEQMWKDRFEWLWEHGHEDLNEGEEGEEKMTEFIFPIVLHPDTSGMAHVIGMVERILLWLKGKEGKGVEFCRYEDIAREAKVKAESEVI